MVHVRVMVRRPCSILQRDKRIQQLLRLPLVDLIRRSPHSRSRYPLLERAAHRVEHRLEDLFLVRELHLKLRRVNIHVHRRRRDSYEQNAGRKFIRRNIRRIRLLQRRLNAPRLHVPPVNEHILIIPVYPYILRRPDIPADNNARLPSVRPRPDRQLRIIPLRHRNQP